MKKIIDKTIAIAIFAMAIFAFTACSVSGDGFKIDARFLNMNQADFYVYSPDGAIEGIDTIHVNAGRFTYEGTLQQEGTVVIVFPNYATMPIFVEPGASISIDANAAHIREMEVTGTDANEIFTEWRKNTQNLSPDELKNQAEVFINDHPETPVSRWLLSRYFIECQKPDIKKAQQLVKKMQKATENNLNVTRLATLLDNMGNLNVGDQLPRFSAQDINGNPVLNGSLMQGTTIILLWASWNYESTGMLRQLSGLQENGEAANKVDHVVTICMDPSVKQCRKTLKANDAEKFTNICDTMIWDSPLIKTFGFSNIPDNIRLENGKVVMKSVSLKDLTKQ